MLRRKASNMKPLKILFYQAAAPFSEIEYVQRPLWPAYLAAYVEKKYGTEVFYFIYKTGAIKKLLDYYNPDLVCVSSVTQYFEYAIDVANSAHAQKIPVIIGGIHISSLPTSLSRTMDVACIGEGEETFADLLALFSAKGSFQARDLVNIPGVAFWDGERIIETPCREERLDLNNLPHPKRSLVGYGRHGYIYTARGCPYQCVFCSCTRFWGKVRYASPEYIIEELNEMIDHGVDRIRFADENLSANVNRLEAIAKAIRGAGIHRKVKFSCWCRANNVTPQVVELLKSINVVSVKMGLESGNQRVLDYLKGGVTVEDNHRAVHLFHKAGIQVNADFLFGAPDETKEEIMDTYHFIRRSPISFFDINIFSPLPATPVWDLAKKRGIVSDTTMKWHRLNYKFQHNPREAITLSEVLSYHELAKIHIRFQLLRFWKSLIAIPTSPWRDEIPLHLIKKIIVRFVSIFLR